MLTSKPEEDSVRDIMQEEGCRKNVKHDRFHYLTFNVAYLHKNIIGVLCGSRIVLF